MRFFCVTLPVSFRAETIELMEVCHEVNLSLFMNTQRHLQEGRKYYALTLLAWAGHVHGLNKRPVCRDGNPSNSSFNPFHLRNSCANSANESPSCYHLLIFSLRTVYLCKY